MRIVATQTPLALFHRFVLESSILRPGADIFVTFETEFIGGLAQKELVAGSMGIVAGDTIALDHDPVETASFFRHHVFMATAAKGVDIRYEQIFMR